MTGPEHRTPMGGELPPLGKGRLLTTHAERVASPWYTVHVDLVVSEQDEAGAYAYATDLVQRLHGQGDVKGAFVTEATVTDDLDRDLVELSDAPSTIANEQRTIRRLNEARRREKGGP